MTLKVKNMVTMGKPDSCGLKKWVDNELRDSEGTQILKEWSKEVN